MLRLVLDSNTLLSAFFWKGNEFRLLKRIEQGRASLLLNQEIVDEITAVLRRKKFEHLLAVANISYEVLVQKLIELSELIPLSYEHITVCRDPKDNMFLECAYEGDADIIVSGDKDLLELHNYKHIRILRTYQVLRLLE